MTDDERLQAEQRARRLIDEQLTRAGWVVQDLKDQALGAAVGVAAAAAALGVLEAAGGGGVGYTAAARPGVRSVAVLGEMNELGAGAEQEHALLADELARYRVTHLVAVGKSAAMAALTQRAGDQGIRTTAVADTDEAAQAVRELLASAPAGEDNWRERGDRDVVLVKASNAARLWVVAEALLQGHTLR